MVPASSISLDLTKYVLVAEDMPFVRLRIATACKKVVLMGGVIFNLFLRRMELLRASWL